jgi:hypothetical protein
MNVEACESRAFIRERLTHRRALVTFKLSSRTKCTEADRVSYPSPDASRIRNRIGVLSRTPIGHARRETWRRASQHKKSAVLNVRSALRTKNLGAVRSKNTQ